MTRGNYKHNLAIRQYRCMDNLKCYSASRINPPNGIRDGGDVRGFDAEDFLDGTLREDAIAGKAHVFAQDSEGYLVTTFPPEAVTEKYYHVLFAIQKRGHYPAVTYDDLPTGTNQVFHQALFQCAESVRRTAFENGEQCNDVYAVQHVGPNEINPQIFATSLPQIHAHIHSYNVDAIKESQLFKEMEGECPFESREYRFLFHDPFFAVANDILIHEMSTIDGLGISIHRQNSAFKLGYNTDPNSPFEDREMELMQKLSALWKQKWFEIARCFSDQWRDSCGRFVPLPQPAIQGRLANFLGKHPYLGEEAREKLLWLSRNIKLAENVDKWNWFFEGPNGILAWHFDYEAGDKSVIFAPRSVAIPKKHWAILKEGATHVVRKDRNGVYDEEAMRIAQGIQKQLVRNLGK